MRLLAPPLPLLRVAIAEVTKKVGDAYNHAADAVCLVKNSS